MARVKFEDTARETLDSIVNNIKLYPLENGDSPESIGWEAFIAKHPNYVFMTTGIAFALAENGRAIVGEDDIARASLAGAIMRTHMYDEELTKIGRAN